MLPISRRGCSHPKNDGNLLAPSAFVNTVELECCDETDSDLCLATDDASSALASIAIAGPPPQATEAAE